MNPNMARQPRNEPLRDSTTKNSVLANKKLSNDKERILRKTYEIIERPAYTSGTEKTFATKPKRFRIRRGHPIVIRRCKQIMKHLWQMGFKHGALVRREPIEGAIFYCAGGDYRTIKKYMGFRKLLRKGNALNPPQTIYIQGYLERLHYIERAKRGNYLLRHEAVPLSYHYRESLVPPKIPLPNRVNANKVGLSKEVLCVRGGGEVVESNGSMEFVQRNKTNKHNTHTNQSSESIPKLTDEESRILSASMREES